MASPESHDREAVDAELERVFDITSTSGVFNVASAPGVAQTANAAAKAPFLRHRPTR